MASALRRESISRKRLAIIAMSRSDNLSAIITELVALGHTYRGLEVSYSSWDEFWEIMEIGPQRDWQENNRWFFDDDGVHLLNPVFDYYKLEP